ncbi:hypothetical protein [Roseovarius sp. D22-M7]
MADDADDSQDGSETQSSATEDRPRREPRSRHEGSDDSHRCRFDDFAMI